METPRNSLRRLASTQDGQFATSQASVCGVGRGALANLVRHGEILSLGRGIWRFTAAPGPACVVRSALLRSGEHAVASHATAAWLHRLPGFETPDLVDVTVPRHRRRRLGGIAAHQARLLKMDVDDVRGLATTSLVRTVIDLADAADPWGTLGLLDDAMAKGASRGWMHDRATRLAQGRSGVALLRDATDPDGGPSFRSWLERAGSYVFMQARLPPARWNVEVRDVRGALIGVVDVLWDPWLVITEFEGLRFHTTPAERRNDANRFNRLSDRHTVRRFTWHDLVTDPAGVVRTVIDALASRGAPVSHAQIPERFELPPLGLR